MTLTGFDHRQVALLDDDELIRVIRLYAEHEELSWPEAVWIVRTSRLKGDDLCDLPCSE